MSDDLTPRKDDVPKASTTCPICHKSEPHHHSDNEIKNYRQSPALYAEAWRKYYAGTDHHPVYRRIFIEGGLFAIRALIGQPARSVAGVVEVEQLREWKAAVLGKCKHSDGWNALKWAGDKDGWGFVHYFIGHLETRALHAETVLAEQDAAPPDPAVREAFRRVRELASNHSNFTLRYVGDEIVEICDTILSPNMFRMKQS